MRQYSPQEFQAKASIDITLFGELFAQYLHESEIPAFTNQLIKVYDLAQELHEESNVVPQLSMTSLRSKRKLQSLTENEIKELFYNSFRDKVNKSYVEPLERGKLLTLNENDVDKIIHVIVKSDSTLDPEISKKYGLFEKTISSALKDVILPRDTILGMKDYVDGVKPEYFEVFDRNLKIVKAEFNDAVEGLVKNLALRMFKSGMKVADNYDKDSFDIDNYQGISSFISDKDELDDSLDKITISKPSLDDEEITDLIDKD